MSSYVNSDIVIGEEGYFLQSMIAGMPTINMGIYAKRGEKPDYFLYTKLACMAKARALDIQAFLDENKIAFVKNGHPRPRYKLHIANYIKGLILYRGPEGVVVSIRKIPKNY